MGYSMFLMRIQETRFCLGILLEALLNSTPSPTGKFKIMAGIQKAIDSGAVPGHVSNVCPPGTKAYLLEVGWLECDEGFVVRGGNTSLKSNEGKSFVNKRREMPMYCILIDHPHEGCILWETGSGADYPTVWGPEVSDVFSRVRYEPKHELKAAIEATGHKLEDIKKMYPP